MSSRDFSRKRRQDREHLDRIADARLPSGLDSRMVTTPAPFDDANYDRNHPLTDPSNENRAIFSSERQAALADAVRRYKTANRQTGSSPCVVSSDCASGFRCAGGTCQPAHPGQSVALDAYGQPVTGNTGGPDSSYSGSTAGTGGCAPSGPIDPAYPIPECGVLPSSPLPGGAGPCNNDNCYSNPGPTQDPVSPDNDCGPGQCCRFNATFGKVVCSPGYCPGYEPPQPIPTCGDDSDCAPGTYCSGPTNTCVPFPGQPQPPYTPVFIPCDDAGDCPEGAYCSGGFCASGPCDTSADCSGNQVCYGGECRPTSPGLPQPPGADGGDGTGSGDGNGDDSGGSGSGPCNPFCSTYKDIYGNTHRNCEPVSECDECTTCLSNGDGTSSCQNSILTPGPCWCNPQKCQYQGRGCSSCDDDPNSGSYGDCIEKDDSCSACHTAEGPCCDKTISATACVPVEVYGPSAPLYAKIAAERLLEEYCDEIEEKDDNCNPDDEPDEPCDCNCHSDCPDCELCGADGKCYPDPACEVCGEGEKLCPNLETCCEAGATCVSVYLNEFQTGAPGEERIVAYRSVGGPAQYSILPGDGREFVPCDSLNEGRRRLLISNSFYTGSDTCDFPNGKPRELAIRDPQCYGPGTNRPDTTPFDPVLINSEEESTSCCESS